MKDLTKNIGAEEITAAEEIGCKTVERDSIITRDGYDGI